MRHVAKHPVADKSAVFPAPGFIFTVNVDFNHHRLVSGHFGLPSVESSRIVSRVKNGLQGKILLVSSP
jgi:hypothetical protein